MHKTHRYEMKPIDCAICGPKAHHTVVFPERINQNKISFAARRTPTKIHYRIVRCEKCGLIFSNPIFPNDKILKLYSESEFIQEPQLENMAIDYLSQLQDVLQLLDENPIFLEIGCANGFFLKKARSLGFSQIWGVEPCREAVDRADQEIKRYIINEIFHNGLFEREKFDIICVFQVFDHLLDPNTFLKDIFKILKPGGFLLSINHIPHSVGCRVQYIFNISDRNIFKIPLSAGNMVYLAQRPF